jgi:hypothetical protein
MMKKRSNTKLNLILAVFFLLIGIALCVVTVIFFKNYYQDKSRCTEKIQAIVIGYKYIPPATDEDDADYRPIIEYEVDNKTYTKILTNYLKRPKEGSYITIYYNPTNPNDIFFEENTGFYLAPIGSTVFSIAGLALVYSAIREHKNKGTIYFE